MEGFVGTGFEATCAALPTITKATFEGESLCAKRGASVKDVKRLGGIRGASRACISARNSKVPLEGPTERRTRSSLGSSR